MCLSATALNRNESSVKATARNSNESPQSSSEEVSFTENFSKKLITNTFFNVLGRSWSFLISLVLTPYILSRLNVADFGAWIILTILINSFNLLDLGLGFAFVRYIAAYYTYEDYPSINKVLFSGLAFYSVLGIVGVILGLLLEAPVVHLLRITPPGYSYLLVLLSCWQYWRYVSVRAERHAADGQAEFY